MPNTHTHSQNIARVFVRPIEFAIEFRHIYGIDAYLHLHNIQARTIYGSMWVLVCYVVLYSHLNYCCCCCCCYNEHSKCLLHQTLWKYPLLHCMTTKKKPRKFCKCRNVFREVRSIILKSWRLSNVELQTNRCKVQINRKFNVYHCQLLIGWVIFKNCSFFRILIKFWFVSVFFLQKLIPFPFCCVFGSKCRVRGTNIALVAIQSTRHYFVRNVFDPITSHAFEVNHKYSRPMDFAVNIAAKR